MPTRAEILRLLADGRFHSGTDLGRTLGISRAAVCKGIKGLTEMGVSIHRLAGRGYRLEAPFVPLDADSILAHVGPIPLPIQLELVEHTDSTNQHLLRRIELESGAVCLAETQSAGRGRRGRGWIATPYSNILLSMAWRFETGPAVVAGLSLAAGVAVLRAFDDYGIRGAGLKWPNDILADGRKLAGLLVDVRGEAAGPCVAVLGLGVNIYIGADDAARIDQPWVDLKRLHGDNIDRNRLTGALISRLYEMFSAFALTGFAPFIKEWEERHLLADQEVRVLQGETVQVGRVRGIDPQGALILEYASGARRHFFSGEVSLRAVS